MNMKDQGAKQRAAFPQKTNPPPALMVDPDVLAFLRRVGKWETVSLGAVDRKGRRSLRFQLGISFQIDEDTFDNYKAAILAGIAPSDLFNSLSRCVGAKVVQPK